MSLDFIYIAAFGSGTLILGFGALALLLSWWPTRHWQPAEARVEALKVIPKAGKYVRMNPHVIARYTYTFNGAHYVGHRISVFEVRPRLFEGYRPNMLREVDESIVLERPVIIHVDPKHPDHSVLLNPPVKGHLIASFLGAFAFGIVLAFFIHYDANTVSIIAGCGIAFLLFLVSLIFRDGVQVLMVFGGA